jgi:GNAT superfamily N-acetyltransferase
MSVIIKEVVTNSDLKKFIDFPYSLYKNNPFFVPALSFDEKATLGKKNPALDYCKSKYWLAYKNNKVVGRVAAILNKSFIEKWENKYLRFGWIDFEEDQEIVNALLNEVENWAKELGMIAVHGPMGFTDLDHEGMLVEGFEELGTLAAIYNYPYYPILLEKAGYKKDVDWVEYKITLPKTVPPKLEQLASIVKRRNNLSLVQAKKAKDILPYAKDIFRLINESYSDLYGVTELTEKQIAYYTKQYFSFIRPEFVPLVKDENGNIIAFAVSMPSLSKALQKAKGSLFPFGFLHILKAMKKNDIADLYLVAVDKKYQGKGVNAILMYELAKVFIANGMFHVESNPELELNHQIQSFWKHFDAIQHKRRRCFIKMLQ